MEFRKSRVWYKVMLSVANDMDLPEEEKVLGLAMIGEQFLNCLWEETATMKRAAESADIEEASRRG